MLYVEGFAYHFPVIKVVFDALNFLIVFVSLAGNEDYVARFGDEGGGAYGFAAIDNAEGAWLVGITDAV